MTLGAHPGTLKLLGLLGQQAAILILDLSFYKGWGTMIKKNDDTWVKRGKLVNWSHD
jgi:hypothetical protein